MNRSKRLLVLGVSLLASGCANHRGLPQLQPDPRLVARRAADCVLKDFPQPPPFDWGEGVLMAGMMRAGRATDDERYVQFVRGWADHWRASGIDRLLSERGYCGHWGPGCPLLMLYERTRERAYLDMAAGLVDFMQTKATRTSDGGLGHWRDNHQLWVDTLYMSCPVYADYGRLTGQPDLVREAARQLIASQRHLQDERTGLFYHMYDESSGKHSPEFWGRGNGWTAMAYVETLRTLPANAPEYGTLAEQFRRLAAGLVATQDAQTSLWYTVLNRPDSYLETSASAMILYALAEGYRLEWMNLDDPRLIARAWQTLAARIDPEGRVIDVSAGTGPTTFDVYAKIPKGTYTWGTGAFLLAAGALAEH